ncbi:MAG: AAA family ATPase [Chloroflexi bacterium]|nr:AAA family ATPase [Chloroflexota bacterium]
MSGVETKPPVIRGLLLAEAYSHPSDDIVLHETHGAWVVLAGPYAYKLKKPVNLGFFDFSTPERRAADSEAEVRLNRRLAPATYLGVVDVVERDGAIFVGGPGRVLERAVWMRRLPADGMLSSLLDRNEATPALIRRIARTMARFHARAATGPGVDEHGARATIEANWRENIAQIAPYVDRTIPAGELARIERIVTGTLRARIELFDRRVAEGRVRDGHGDLHARSICLVGDELVIFDCIEFSARYRCADVAAEIAFLAMDLDHAGRADLGWTFVTEYVHRSGDRDLPRLLDFYTCYRAFVRGKVLSLRLAEGGLSADERRALCDEARAYFDLATAYANGVHPPLVIATSGLPGSGKSTLARALARRLGLVYLSTDITRKRAVGLHPSDRAGAAFRAGLYGPEQTRATYAALRRHAATWLRRGASVVLDGTFGDPHQRQLARRLAQREGVRFILVRTTCDEATARNRIRQREADPERVSDATWEVYQEMAGAYVEPAEIPADELYVDATGGAGAEELVRLLLAT